LGAGVAGWLAVDGRGGKVGWRVTGAVAGGILLDQNEGAGFSSLLLLLLLLLVEGEADDCCNSEAVGRTGKTGVVLAIVLGGVAGGEESSC
jgi:hypothetical protein